jgi:cytochrome c5
MKIYILIGLVAIIVSLESCYYDKFDEIHPTVGYKNTCDTTLANTYTGSINAIMQVNCVGCHSSAAPTQNIALDSYNAVKAAAANGSLKGTMTHSSGYNAMPPTTPAQQCEIDRVQKWINAGMPE